MIPDDETWVRRRRWWRRPRWIAALVALGLALAAGGVVLLRPDDDSCAIAGHRVEGQCIGISDGSYRFTRNLARVSGLIHQQNAAVRGPYVSIVYLTPLDPGPKDTYTPDSVRHQLEGAYTAQRQANDPSGGRGDDPRIKLLLANGGTTDAQHDAVVEAIRGRIERDHIVAVAGLGTSTDATLRMIRKVTAFRGAGGLQLGAVAPVLTADSLTTIPGLVRTAPTNSDEAAAAVQFLRRPEHAAARVLVVQDVRSDDQYTASLGRAFVRLLPRDRSAGPAMTYDSSQGSVATAFVVDMPTLCAARPDVVYFAGRGVDLPKFLAALRLRGCKGRPLVVLSGDDASQVVQTPGFHDIKDILRTGNIRILYTGLAHPGAWTEANAAYYDRDAVDAFRPHRGPFSSAFPDESLDDGQAIMSSDAVQTAVQGARAVFGISHKQVTGSDMIQIWRSLNSTNAVHGASGYVSLDSHGSPVDKAVPVIEITGDGAVRTVRVSSAGRTPYVPPPIR